MSALRLARGVTRPRPRSSSSPAATTATRTRCSPRAGSGLATLGIPSSPGVPAGAAAGHGRLRLQRRRRGGARPSSATGEGLAAIIVEPVAGQHGRRPAGARLPRGAARALRRLGRAARLRRGDHRLPRRARRCAGALRRRARPDRPREDRRRRAAARGVRRAGATSWTSSPRRGRSTRRARSPGTRSRRPPRSSSCAACAIRPSTSGSRRPAARLEAGLAGRRRRRAGLRPAGRRDARRCSSATGPVARLRRGAARATPSATAAFFRHLLARGVYVAPSQFEAMFVSTAHGEAEIDATVEAAQSSSAADLAIWATIAERGGGARASSGRPPCGRPPSGRDARLLAARPTSAPLSGSRRSTRATCSTTGGRGSSRPADRDTAILLGDYLYAHGLVRVAALGDVDVRRRPRRAHLALRPAPRRGRAPGDGAAWAATVALLGAADGRARGRARSAPARPRPGPAARARAARAAGGRHCRARSRRSRPTASQ